MSNQLVHNEQESFKYCEDTRVLKDRIEKGYLELGRRLIVIKTNNLAEGQYGGFESYLDELKIKSSTAQHIMRVYQRLVLDFGLSEAMVLKVGGYTRAYEILPKCTTPEKAVELIERAALLPNRVAVTRMIKDMQEDQNGACSHESTFDVRVCNDCGEKWKLFDGKPEVKN